jgi:CubicO group peptidase (beta-lactamase class C family)
MGPDFQTLDDYIALRMQQAGTPALALALFDRERCVRVFAHGYTDLEARTRVLPDALFEIGSITKTFTGVAVVQAAEDGLLNLDAPVTEYLPWFFVQSKYEQPIRVRHLLNHTAGLVGVIDKSPDIRGAIYALRDTEAVWAPGERISYSDAGYQILTLVLEHVTGQSYPNIIQQRIFDPLGMTASFGEITQALRPRLARGYTYLHDDRPPYPGEPLVPAAFVEIASGDGSIASTAEDMSKFGRMLLNRGRGDNGTVLSPEAFDLLTRNTFPSPRGKYGYGILMTQRDGFNYWGHGGDMPGYAAELLVDPEHGVGVVMLSTHQYPPGLHRAALDFWRALHLGNPQAATLPPSPSAELENATAYVGTYQSPGADGKTLTVGEDHGQLLLHHNGQIVPLESRGGDSFYVAHPDFSLFLLNFGRTEPADAGETGADGEVVEAWYGSDWYVKDTPAAETLDRDFAYPPEWEAYPGHYCSHIPWQTNFRVVLRKGHLWLVWPHGDWPHGDEDRLVLLESGEFQVGEALTPERIRFADIVDGQALRAVLSTCDYYRFFTP